MKARFSVYEQGGWLTCKPLNAEAVKIIHGKKIALWPGPQIYRSSEPFEFKKKK